MTNPFKYRPPVRDDGLEIDYWEDNWLSNLMAWGSDKFFPKWCSAEGHWTIRFMDKFWADCSCCLFFRGILIGALTGLIIGALL